MAKGDGERGPDPALLNKCCIHPGCKSRLTCFGRRVKPGQYVWACPAHRGELEALACPAA